MSTYLTAEERVRDLRGRMRAQAREAVQFRRFGFVMLARRHLAKAVALRNRALLEQCREATR